MKKLLSITLTTLLVLFASQAFGQTVSQDVTAEASVISALTVTKNFDLEFGNVIAGNDGTILIDSEGNANATNSSDPQLGQFTLDGSAGEAYAISFTIPDNLVSTTSDETLTFTMTGNNNFGRVENSDDQDGNFDPADGRDVAFDAEANNIIIKIGGQVEPTSAQALETYNGTVTINLTDTTL